MQEAHIANCQWMNQSDCLPVLSQLCLNQGGESKCVSLLQWLWDVVGVRDVEVRVMSLRCMSRVVRFVPDAKKLLVKLRVFLDGQPVEALLVSERFHSVCVRLREQLCWIGAAKDGPRCS